MDKPRQDISPTIVDVIHRVDCVKMEYCEEMRVMLCHHVRLIFLVLKIVLQMIQQSQNITRQSDDDLMFLIETLRVVILKWYVRTICWSEQNLIQDLLVDLNSHFLHHIWQVIQLISVIVVRLLIQNMYDCLEQRIVLHHGVVELKIESLYYHLNTIVSHTKKNVSTT